MVKDKGVLLKVSNNFFDNIFEPARKNFEKKTGTRVGQVRFTEFLAMKNFNIKLPKTKELFKEVKIKRKRFDII